MKRIARQKGFTLVEIVVVIAVIAILFTILLSQIGRAKRRAQVSAVKEGLVAFRIEAQLQARNDPAGYANVCDITTKSGAALLRVVRRVIPTATDIVDGNGVGINCQVGNGDSFAVDANSLFGSMGLTENFCVDSNGTTGDVYYASGSGLCEYT